MPPAARMIAARDELDEEDVDVPVDEAVDEDAEEQRAEDGAEHRDIAAGEPRPADDRRGEGDEQPVLADRRVGVAEPGDEEDRGAGGEEAGEGVDRDLQPADRYAVQLGGARIGAEGEDLPAEGDVAEDEGEHRRERRAPPGR